MPTTRVVILAAGKGTRMKSDIPKPLIPVAGEPMVTRLIRSVKESGIDEQPIVVVGAWSEAMFREALGDSVDYAVQVEILGTGHAVRVAKDIAGDAERIVVLYGDHPFLSPSVIQSIAELQETNPGAFVMLTSTVPNFEGDFQTFVRWGRILRDGNGAVTAIREAKDATPEELAITEVNPSIFAFPAAWAWDRLERLKNANASGEYYLTDLVSAAMEDGMSIVTASADPLDVIGINSPEELARAEELRRTV
jgi:bifunctional UDP-N-acetylglucosamine pyrophosphorylase / glucosamine-1-phosphate N-acetyltransferase